MQLLVNVYMDKGENVMTKSIFTENYALFLKLLVASRKHAGLTQKEIEDKLHKNQSYVSKYENGERRLDVIEFADVANAIGVDPLKIMQELLKGWKNN